MSDAGSTIRVVARTRFVPSAHGFQFPNVWSGGGLPGKLASRGLCGGMIFAALDHFYAGEPVPRTEGDVAPAQDSRLARYIWRRQVASVGNALGSNLWRFACLTYLPTHVSCGAAEVARREIASLTDALGAGRPVPLGLVGGFAGRRLFRNHQVLAVGVSHAPDRTIVHVYDPNHPLRDDVVIEVPFDVREPVVERIGSHYIVWRGLFVERYLPVRVASTGMEPLIERAAPTTRYWLAGGVLLLCVWLLRSITRDRGRSRR